MNVRSLLPLLSALFLTSCGTVTVKQIAGDQVPGKVVADLCKGSWRGPDGVVGVFHIVDEAKGIVEVQAREAGRKDVKTYFALRKLGERVVATGWGKEPPKAGEPMAFLRVAVTPDHVSFFLPNMEVFKEGVKKNRIAGEVQQIEAAKVEESTQKTESVVLEKFGLAEAEKLGGALNCFDADPGMVLVREAAPRPDVKTGDSGKGKKPVPAPAGTGAGKRR